MKGPEHVGEGQVVVQLDALVALSPSQERAVVEHVFGERVERPEVALSRIAWLARYLDEAVVETNLKNERERELLTVAACTQPHSNIT
jgi:ribosomal protein L18E